MKLRQTTLNLAALLLLSSLPAVAPAEVLLMDAIAEEPVNSVDGLPRPGRNTSMESVIVRYGEPTERVGTVGEPPITRWDYPGYSVFFEHDKVLTSVVHR